MTTYTPTSPPGSPRPAAGRRRRARRDGAIHRHFGHNLPLAERLAVLDDEYDLGFDPGTYATMTREQIDQEVLAEARRLTHEQAGQRAARNDQ